MEDPRKLCFQVPSLLRIPAVLESGRSRQDGKVVDFEIFAKLWACQVQIMLACTWIHQLLQLLKRL